MLRSEVLAWLQAGGGQRGQAQIEYVDVANPKYQGEGKIGLAGQKTIKAKQVTWTREDGETLVAIDHERRDQEAVASDFRQNPDGTQTYDPDYEVVGGAPKKEAVDSRTPEAKEADTEETAQRRRNKADPAYGRYETDAVRRRDELQDAETRRRADIDDRANALREREISIREAESDRSGRREQTEIEARQRAQENDAERIRLEKERVEIERSRANPKQVIGKAGTEDQYVGVFNPQTGQIETQANPLYDEVKTAAARKKEELALAIQMRQMDAQEAAQEYQRWYQENVELPFKQMAERRAQTTETRQAQDMEERRRQFAATNELNRATLGQTAGQNAVQNELATLPFRAGPAFGEQFSSAINSLAGGGKMDANASAGINFTADAFEYKRPDLDKIARKATKAALAGVTKYDPDAAGPIAQTDYSGINMAPDLSQAPPSGSSIDVGTLWNNLYGTPTPPPFQFRPAGG